jgi:tRNA-2-methylthio-N6-dimethylallyladenosine synthase
MIPAQTFHVITYGCQMNDADSDHVVGLLQSRGLEQVDVADDADLVLVNTCCVRGGAEERSLGRLANLRPWRQRGGHRRLVVMGCTAQKEGADLLERLPHADLIVGTRDLARLEEHLEESYRGSSPLVRIEAIDEPVIPQFGSHLPRGRVRALVNIMVGCDKNCSYCIVPQTRGKEISRPVGEIVDEVTRLVDAGAKEVLLLGQNVNSYRSERVKNFPELLERVNEIAGLERIRFITSHPVDFREGLIAAMRDLPKVMENIHLPAQAGATSVLNRMRRTYTRERYLELVAALREAIPEPASSITTDIICGFPGESEAEFEETRTLLEVARWDSAFIFLYSPREGTHAADTMADDVPNDVKQQRVAELVARQKEISAEKNARLIGREEEVLFEMVSRRSEAELMGRTRTDKAVIVPAPRDLVGTVQRVRITDAHPHTLFGELVDATVAVA